MQKTDEDKITFDKSFLLLKYFFFSWLVLFAYLFWFIIQILFGYLYLSLKTKRKRNLKATKFTKWFQI